MPKIKLASQRLNAPSRGGLLQPSMLSGRAAGQITSGPGINAPRIGAPQLSQTNVQYTPTRPPQVQADELTTALIRGGEFTNVMTKAAFDYNQRQDKVVADFHVLELSNELRDLYYGKIGADGTVEGGYVNTSELEASQGYGKFQSEVERVITQRMENMTPQQQQFAANRFHQQGNAYLVNGSQHATTQLGAAQEKVKDETFNGTMEAVNTSIITGGAPDLGTMADSLAQFSDPAEKRTRTNEMVKGALATTLRVQGAQQMRELALAINSDPRISAGVAINEFLDSVTSKKYAKETAERSRETHARATRAYALGENDKVVDNYVDTNIYKALRTDLSGFIGAVSSKYSSDSVAKTQLEAKLSDAITQEWRNISAMNDVDMLADFQRDVKAQAATVDKIYRDDIVATLDKMEREELVNDNKLKTAKNTSIEQDVKAQQLQISDELAALTINAKELPPEALVEEVDDLINRPHVTDNQVVQAYRLVDGSRNPKEEQIYTNVLNNWEEYYQKPQNIIDLDVRGELKQQLLKDARTIRNTEAAPILSLAMKSLAQDYMLQADKMGEMMLIGELDESVPLSKAQIKGEYYKAAQLLTSMAMSNLRIDKNMTPGEAVSKAQTTLYNDPNIVDKMVGRPKTAPNALGGGKSTESDRNTYEDDHAAVKSKNLIPNLKGFKGPSNIVDFVKTIGAEEEKKGEMGRDPYMVAVERMREQTEYFMEMARVANTPEEQIMIQQYLANHVRQSNYVLSLLPVSQATTETTDQTTGYHDGDGPVTEERGVGNRSADVAAKESGTPEGDAQTDSANRAFKALGGSGYGKFVTQGGTGFFERYIVTHGIGKTDFDQVFKEELGMDPYTPFNEEETQ